MHFDKYATARAKDPYRMLVLDRHESHGSAEFQEYCKLHNIRTLGPPPHSSHLTQPLDVVCFSVLKRACGRQIETFVCQSLCQPHHEGRVLSGLCSSIQGINNSSPERSYQFLGLFFLVFREKAGPIKAPSTLCSTPYFG